MEVFPTFAEPRMTSLKQFLEGADSPSLSIGIEPGLVAEVLSLPCMAKYTAQINQNYQCDIKLSADSIERLYNFVSNVMSMNVDTGVGNSFPKSGRLS